MSFCNKNHIKPFKFYTNAFCIYSNESDDHDIESFIFSTLGAILCILSAYFHIKLIIASIKKEKEIYEINKYNGDNNTYCSISLQAVQWTRYSIFIGLIPLAITFINFME